MFYFLLALQAVLCLMMIGLVLLQQGKGADMGAAFGGGSNTLFGAGGAGSLISKITTGICIGFMVTSVLLVRAYQHQGYLRSSHSADPLAGSVMEKVAIPAPVEPQSQPAGASNPAAVAPALPPAPAAAGLAPAPQQAAPAKASEQAAADKAPVQKEPSKP